MLIPLLCWGCGGSARRAEPLCTSCRVSLRRLPAHLVLAEGVTLWAPLAYEGPARELVRALKFRGAVGVAEAMAAQVVANAPGGVLDEGVLVPVPLHPSRRRRRGFNQARLLAEAMSRRTGLEVWDRLSRSGAAGTQVGRGRRERRAGPAGAVHTGGRGRRGTGAGAAPARAVLVDDVATTGGTLAACAQALRAGGTEEVVAVTFARTLGR
jgi:ComF family protein